MRFLFRLFTCTAVFLFVVATVIKFVQGTSYKEAVGIMEEYWKEMNLCGMKGGGSSPEV